VERQDGRDAALAGAKQHRRDVQEENAAAAGVSKQL
jgi:hypothetical protein